MTFKAGSGFGDGLLVIIIRELIVYGGAVSFVVGKGHEEVGVAGCQGAERVFDIQVLPGDLEQFGLCFQYDVDWHQFRGDDRAQRGIFDGHVVFDGLSPSLFKELDGFASVLVSLSFG